MKVNTKYNHWLPPILKTDGVTIGNTIYYRQPKALISGRLHRHELKHIEQYQQYGIVGFLAIYILHYTKGRLQGLGHWDAYLRIPFEVEARKAEKE